jgi:hypothetical protein
VDDLGDRGSVLDRLRTVELASAAEVAACVDRRRQIALGLSLLVPLKATVDDGYGHTLAVDAGGLPGGGVRRPDALAGRAELDSAGGRGDVARGRSGRKRA